MVMVSPALTPILGDLRQMAVGSRHLRLFPAATSACAQSVHRWSFSTPPPSLPLHDIGSLFSPSLSQQTVPVPVAWFAPSLVYLSHPAPCLTPALCLQAGIGLPHVSGTEAISHTDLRQVMPGQARTQAQHQLRNRGGKANR